MANLKVTLVKSTIGAIPVSYTHLDVYKRQAQGRAYRIEKRMSHITIVLNER